MSDRVLGVLAGEDISVDSLLQWARGADLLLAADAGADLLVEAGFFPIVIGDMDSTQVSSGYAADKFHYMPDPSSTDCDKLLAVAKDLGVKRITLAAVEGDRFDHMIATVFSALRSKLEVRLVLRQGIAEIIRDDAAKSIAVVPGRLLSLLPLVDSSGVDLEGVQWPLSNAAIHPAGDISISNRTTAERVRVKIESGAALLILEYPETELPIW